MTRTTEREGPSPCPEPGRPSDEVQFRAVIEKSLDAVVLLGPDGTLMYATPSSARLMGYEPAELTGTDGFGYVHPGDRDRVRGAFADLVAAPDATFTEAYRVRHKDGSWRWLEARAVNLLSEPSVGAVVVTYRDVTCQRAAEDAVRRSEEQYRRLFEASPHPMWVFDTQTLGFLAVNDAAVAGYGYTRDEFARLTLRDIRPAEDVPALMADLSTPVRPRVWRHRWKDGTVRAVEVTGHDLEYDGRPGRLVLAHDVTDREHATAALREREELLRMVIDNIPCGVFWKDRDSVYLGCNDLFAHNFGLTGSGAVVGRTDVELGAAPAEAASFRACDRRVIGTGEPQLGIEEVLTRLDGSRTVLLTSKVPLRDAGGAVVGVLGVYQDITDRKRAEEERRCREGRLSVQQAALLTLGRDMLRSGDPGAAVRALTEATARVLGADRVSVWRHTPDHRAIHCSDLYEARGNRHTAGVALSAAEYPAYFRALEESDVIAAGDARTDVRTHEFVSNYLVPLGIGAMLDVPLRPFGRIEGVLCCEWLGPPRAWEADEQVFAMSVGNLVSLAQERWERERAEAAVRAGNARYEAAVRATGQVLYDWDAGTNHLAWGGSHEATLGYAGSEMPGALSGWAALVHPDDWGAFEREVERCRASKSPFRLEYRVRRKDGVYITVYDQGHFVPDPTGAPTERVVGFVADVTDRKRLEEQFRQAQKMEAVGQLAGGVAHDFNNLLTVINGYSDIIRATLHAHDPARPMVEEVKKAGNRAADLTRQLLAFGRQQVLQPKVLDLNAIVSDTAQMLRRLIGEDIELVTRPEPDVLLVRADPGQVSQVLMNLVVNARDAMPTGGTLTVETRNAVLGAGTAVDGAEVRPGPYVRLAVTDTGTGMAEDVRRHIFEPFFTTKELGKGTGLGLATVYGIVKQSGGHIEVETAVGRGTTFRVYLPGIGGATASQNPGESSAPKGAEVVLVVEDEPGVRGLAQLALGKQGYTVLSAASAEEALKLVAGSARAVDLLLTDVVMPGTGGRVLAERLLAAHPNLRVLYMSGYTDDAVVRHGVESERVNFLQKPFTPTSLARKVRSVLDAHVPHER